MVHLDELLDEGGLWARPEQGFDGAAAERLGRALGTLVLRRGHGRVCFLLARSEEADAALRDGLVRGLVMSGHDVRDAGVTDEEGWAESAAGAFDPDATIDETVPVAAGAYLTSLDGGPRIRLLVGGPLSDELRRQLAEVFTRGDFSAGEGRLDLASAEASS